MRNTLFRQFICAAAFLPAFGAMAQQPGGPQPDIATRAANPVVQAALTAFEALPEAERKQIQDDLIWAANFNATVSGQHGPRTHAAILQFQRQLKARETGILEPHQRQALKDVATKAKAAARLSVQADPRTGASLPIPGTLFTKRETLPSGTRWESADGTVLLETGVGKGGATELPAAFDRFVNLQSPGRRVTYKLLRPDFFVVAGEINDRTFYVRYAIGPNNLRGYALSHPTARARELERYVIAIANGFSAVPPMPGANAAFAAAAGVAATTGSNTPGGSTPALQPPGAAAMPASPAGHFLTGLVVAPGRVITASLAAACPDLRVNGKQAKLLKPGNSTAPAEIEADTAGLKPASLPVAMPRPDEPVVIIGFSAGAKPALSVSTGFVGSGSGLRIAAPLATEGGGSVALDRRGALIGMLAAPRQTRVVAGFVPAMSHSAMPAGVILPGASTTAGIPPETTVSNIVMATQPSLVSVACAQALPLPRD